jgi:hypothetical protein
MDSDAVSALEPIDFFKAKGNGEIEQRTKNVNGTREA